MKVLPNLFNPVRWVLLLGISTNNCHFNRMVYGQLQVSKDSPSITGGYLQTWRCDSPIGGGYTFNCTLLASGDYDQSNFRVSKAVMNLGLSVELFRFLTWSVGPSFHYSDKYEDSWINTLFGSLTVTVPLSGKWNLIATFTEYYGMGQQVGIGMAYTLA